MTFEEIKEHVAGLTPDEAITKLNDYIENNPADDNALTIRGMKHWSRGNRALAINDYLAAIKLNPESKAVQALKATNEILDYYNKDLYNP